MHSTAHALGTAVDMHHGLANGVMIDIALEHNVEAVPERFETMAEVVGLDERTPSAFLRWLAELKSSVAVPADLSATDVDGRRLDELADLAIADSCHVNGPRPCTRDDFVLIFEKAFAGTTP